MGDHKGGYPAQQEPPMDVLRGWILQQENEERGNRGPCLRQGIPLGWQLELILGKFQVGFQHWIF
jgi:hypothetical protein